jgi:hypothetical protein
VTQVEPYDPSEDYDGGWEALVDDGHALEDLLIGPVHPYDRDDQYTPAPRWATRHRLIALKYNDPIAAAEGGE